MTSGSNQNWRSKLQGHPPATVLAYEKFLQTRNPQYLDALVVEILRYHHPDPSTATANRFTPESRLTQDLGLDSVSMVEAVFLLEDLLDIEISNEDLERIQTFGELKSYLRTRMDDLPGDV